MHFSLSICIEACLGEVYSSNGIIDGLLDIGEGNEGLVAEDGRTGRKTGNRLCSSDSDLLAGGHCSHDSGLRCDGSGDSSTASSIHDLLLSSLCSNLSLYGISNGLSKIC